MREHMRRKYAPRADWLVRNAAAASRNAWAARLAQRLVKDQTELRRRLRCGQWKQWGSRGYRELRKRGVSVREA